MGIAGNGRQSTYSVLLDGDRVPRSFPESELSTVGVVRDGSVLGRNGSRPSSQGR